MPGPAEMHPRRNQLLGLGAAILLCACVAAVAADGRHSDRRTLIHAGTERSYVLRVPPGLTRGQQALPLVLVLHGGGGNAGHAERMTGFTSKAAMENFIVAYPEGSSRFRDRLLTWNAGHCCGHAMKTGVDDVGFIDALIGRLIAELPVDPLRVYVTGISNGGMMAHRLGIELPHRIAAIAPVVAALFGDEKPPVQPVAALMINGMLDQSVPYRGGRPGGRYASAWDGTPAKPALAQLEFWAAANRCRGTAASEERGALLLWQQQCPEGRSVALYLLRDTGHAWPGGKRGTRKGDAPGSSLNATDIIWNFFRAHAKHQGQP